MLDFENYDYNDVKIVPYASGEDPIALISYTPEYTHVMDIFRGLLAKEELSERALAAVTKVIEFNPSHYSAWDYRFDIVKAVGKKCFDYKEVGLVRDVEPEVVDDGEWLNEMTLQHYKTYQVWNYRRYLETTNTVQYYATEVQLAGMVIAQDSKNFHAWSHLRWVVGQMKKADSASFSFENLLQITNHLLEQDVYNNSCWSFRYFMYDVCPEHLADAIVFEKEANFAKAKIEFAPDNASSWLYLQGIYSRHQLALLPYLARFAHGLCLKHPGDLDYVRAMEIAAEWLPTEEEDKEKAIQTSKQLYQRLIILEPLRAKYWEYKMKTLEENPVAAAAC